MKNETHGYRKGQGSGPWPFRFILWCLALNDEAAGGRSIFRSQVQDVGALRFNCQHSCARAALFPKCDVEVKSSLRSAYLSSMHLQRSLLASIGVLIVHIAGSQVTISEVSAHNGVADIQGETSDWIELRNDGAQAVELGSFALNDDFSTDDAVPLPNITLDAGERLLILASGEDRTYLPENWRCRRNIF